MKQDDADWKLFTQTGAGTTASRLGMADLGLAQLHDMKTNAEMIVGLDPYGPPLIADMDTGYGGELVGRCFALLNKLLTS
jgi:methylisocitrate lyase